MGYFDPPRPRVFGHRGAAGLAPENTLPSFALAAALGAGYIELDVHGTRDGVPVVLHDAALDRTTDGGGLVRDLPLAAVTAFDAGFRFTPDGRTFPYRGQGVEVPTLEAVVRAFPDRRFNIEIKQDDPPLVDAVVAVLDRTGTADRALLAAEHAAIMRAIRAAVGNRIATGTCAEEVAAFIDRCNHDAWGDYTPPGKALQVPPRFGDIELVTPRTIAAAHRFGTEVHVWTINDPAEIDRLLDLGVDGIMSDFPGLVTAAVTRRPILRPSPTRR